MKIKHLLHISYKNFHKTQSKLNQRKKIPNKNVNIFYDTNIFHKHKKNISHENISSKLQDLINFCHIFETYIPSMNKPIKQKYFKKEKFCTSMNLQSFFKSHEEISHKKNHNLIKTSKKKSKHFI